MKIGCVIQARTGSSRLPDKILLSLPYKSETSALQQVIRRVTRSEAIDSIVIATTTKEEDIKIVNVAEKENVKFFRGSSDNVLERYYYAAKQENLDVVVRITSDCPCIDYNIITRLATIHLENKNDYTANMLKRTFPVGLDVEVFNFSVLEYAYKNATLDYEREHVTPYIHISHPEKFKLQNIEASEALYGPEIRITLDTRQDYNALCAVYDSLYSTNNFFTGEDVVALYKNKPWLKELNNDIIAKKTCKNLEEELLEAIRVLKIQALFGAAKLLSEVKI